jgi:hypothetical protein
MPGSLIRLDGTAKACLALGAECPQLLPKSGHAVPLTRMITHLFARNRSDRMLDRSRCFAAVPKRAG